MRVRTRASGWITRDVARCEALPRQSTAIPLIAAWLARHLNRPNCETSWICMGALDVAAAVWCSWVWTAAFFRRIDARRVDGDETVKAPTVFSASPSAPEKGVGRGDQRYPAQIGDAIASQEAPRIQA